MDEIDHKLMSLLRQDARLTVAALAAKLQVSRGTVTNRIRRLEDDGVIVGYTVRLRPDVQHNEIKAWMSIAVDGNQTRVVIASLLGEPAQADKVAPAVRLYQAYFLRVPDTGGITYWVEQVRKGVSLDKVSDTFARSSEFINRYGKLANADFVRRVYLNLFEREPDPGGYLFWTAQLDDGKARGWVMRQLCESAEYVRKTDSGVAVVSLHLAMLGRAPNATDSQNWTSMARANTGALAMLAAQIRGTDEYVTRALG